MLIMCELLIIVDGQKTAKRLSRNITKETATARSILVEYNTILSTVANESGQCSLQEVLSPDSKFWDSQQRSEPSTTVTWDTKKDIYLMVQRSEEELALLYAEKSHTLAYWAQQQAIIKQSILNLEHLQTNIPLEPLRYLRNTFGKLSTIILCVKLHLGLKLMVRMTYTVIVKVPVMDQ